MHSSICDFLLDIIQNSLEADSSAVIVSVEETDTALTVTVSDNGSGMTDEELEAAQDPFFTKEGKHTQRKAGLGIPFLAQTAQMTDGVFEIRSGKGMGTSVLFSFSLDHIDTPPIGDFPSVFLAALSFPGDYEMVIHRSLRTANGSDEYQLTRSELTEILGDFSLSGTLSLLRSYVRSQESALQELQEKRKQGGQSWQE